MRCILFLLAVTILVNTLSQNWEQIQSEYLKLVIDLSAGKGPKRRLAVCCLPVTYQLSLKKAAAAHGVAKAIMADPHDAEKSSGYIPGGISPIGQKHQLPTVVDESAQLWDSIFVSGGRRGLDIEITPQDLANVTGANFADLLA